MYINKQMFNYEFRVNYKFLWPTEVVRNQQWTIRKKTFSPLPGFELAPYTANDLTSALGLSL